MPLRRANNSFSTKLKSLQYNYNYLKIVGGKFMQIHALKEFI